jgi:hypothetical protein
MRPLAYTEAYVAPILPFDFPTTDFSHTLVHSQRSLLQQTNGSFPFITATEAFSRRAFDESTGYQSMLNTNA